MKKLSCLLGFICVAVGYSVSTAEIEALRLRVENSSVELTASEKNVISNFWSGTLEELMLAENSKDCVEIRKQLAAQKGSTHVSNYAAAYIEHAKSAIDTAFVHAQRLQGTQHRQIVKRNLMILTAELQSPALAPLALQRLDDEDVVMRYWAFKAVTNPAVLQQLTSQSAGGENALTAILAGLKEQISVVTQAEIQKMIIGFCGAIDNPAARDILLSIADRRIEVYRNWTVTDELLDTRLLTALGNIAMFRDGPDKQNFGRKFAELYAAVIQRYLKGQEVLSAEQTEPLLTVIAEVDQNVLGQTMGIKTGILTSLQRKTGLEREYETLFGDRMRPGQLAALLNFDYGKDDSGKSITAPPELGPVPEKIANQN